MAFVIAPLNYKELAIMSQNLQKQVEGLGFFVEKLIIPHRPEFSGGYIKNEWALKIQSKKQEAFLVFGIRSHSPYCYFTTQKLKNASHSTHSIFGLSLSQNLKGQKLSSIQSLPNERALLLQFESGLALLLFMIPALPEALLLKKPVKDFEGSWDVVARSRGSDKTYRFPKNSNPPQELAIREGLIESVERYARALEADLQHTAFEKRKIEAKRSLSELQKQLKTRIKQSETTLHQAKSETDWKRLGDLLKGSLKNQPDRIKGKTRTVTDFETQAEVEIPADPKMNAKEQLEKYYSAAKRKIRRIEEASDRLEVLSAKLQDLQNILSHEPIPMDWKQLSVWEQFAGIEIGVIENKKSKKQSPWLGRTYTSRDGLKILAGKTKDENLELTFKIARGNDVWLHVKGKPGAHVVIPLNSGKSAPLETLLDAAHLCIYLSGGENWGATEVDYTYKKYVKRIKDSSEASYTHNKTLMIKPDKKRLERLLSGQALN